MPGKWEHVTVKPALPRSARSSGGPSPSVPPTAAPPADIQVDESVLPRLERFVVEQPIRKLTDLIVPEATLAQIRTLLAKLRYHRALYEEWDLKSIDPYGKRVAINLFGPPGTGKSFCAEAVASELGQGIIRVSYAEIESKYVGETPKNIKAAFAKARETGAVLFFDEADSILGRRLTNVTQSADHGVNVSRSVMLLELDHFQGITLFATNLASNYDGAFVRRILGHVEMSLPDAACRERLWAKHVPAKMPRYEPVDFQALAQSSDGLSGGDILNAVITAASGAVQREGDQRCLRMDDFHQAIASIRRAKQEIGAPTGAGPMIVEDTTVPASKLPDDVSAELAKVPPAGSA